jgi:hypothetical protein
MESMVGDEDMCGDGGVDGDEDTVGDGGVNEGEVEYLRGN